MLNKASLSHILRTVFFFMLLSMLAFSCSKQLSASGASNFGAMSLYLQPDSDVKVFSYLNTYPEYVTSLTHSDGAITVPSTVLVPKLNFGVPENPLIYINRTNPATPTPLDLFVKIYSPSSKSKDFYFEIPVMGAVLVPSNTTTALSWVLRYSFSKQVVSLSYNQFTSLMTKIEVACADCRDKTNTEVVNLILSNTNLSGSILDEVKKSNASLAISALNYEPSPLDYAWSNPTISSNWQILASFDEPINLDDTVNMNINSILVNPSDSPNQVSPQSWSHIARLDEGAGLGGSTNINLPNISGTPLDYDFDRFSSGIHTFFSNYTGVASTPLTVVASVLDRNRTPLCLNEVSIPVQANHVLNIKLDQTIKPKVLDNTDAETLSLKTSEVAVSSIQNLPVMAAGVRYDVIFNTTTSPVSYRIDKTTASGSTTTIQNQQPYISGRSIMITETDNRFTLFATGTPNNGDKIRFYLPVNPEDSSNFIDRIGCIDPDPSIESGLNYELVSGPAGLTLSASGRITWISDISFYNANPSHTTSMTANVTDSTGLTRQFTSTIVLTEDKFPRLCLTKNGSGVCSGAGPTRLPALPTTGYAEITSVNQMLYASDEDGDPIKLTIVAISPTSSSVSLVSDASTGFASMTLVTSSTAAASTTSVYDYRWNFVPHMNQVVTVASATVRAEIRLAYDTAVDPTLSSSNLATYQIDIVVNNTLDAPLRVASSIADCGGVSCTTSTSVQANYSPQVFTTFFSAASAAAVLINPSNGLPDTVAGNGIAPRNILFEGASATVIIPVIAVRQNNVTSATPIMYEISQQTNTCPFIKAGRVKIEEMKCDPMAVGNDCLRLFLNYDSRTGVPEVLPRFSPSKCSFNLFARDASLPDSATPLGAYNLYIQDITEAPYLKPSPPANIQSFLGRFPIEGESINLMPFIQSFAGDTESGAYDRSVSSTATVVSATTDRRVTLADGVSTNFNILQFNASSISPEVRMNVPAPGSGNTFLIQQSNDNFVSNVQSFANNSVRQEITGLVVELANTGFTGRVRFQSKTASATVWSNLNVTNLATAATTSSTTTGGRFYISTATTSQYRVHVESLSAGTVTGSVISNILMSNSTSVSGTTLFFVNGILSAPLSPLVFTTERPLTTTPANFATGTYSFPVSATAPFMRARFTTTATLANETGLPNIRVTSNIIDPNNSGFYYHCFVESSGPTYTPCFDSSFTDSDGNAFFAPEFRKFDLLRGIGSPVDWKIPFSFATEGNSSATATVSPGSMQRTAKVHLRMVDKGFYDSLTLTPLTATCGAGSPAYSCIDHTFDVTVIDDPAVPTVKFYDNIGNLINGATFRPQLRTNSSIEPTFTVTEDSSLLFSIEVSPYSDHSVDQVNFRMLETSCSADGGSCLRQNGTSMLSAITNPSLSGDLQVTSPTTFVFKIAPNATDGNSNTVGSTARTYNYKYALGESCLDPTTCAGPIHPTKQNAFGFKIKVVNKNNPPTGISLFPDMPVVRHPNINSFVRCGTTQACTMNGNFSVDFDMSKAQNSRDYIIPLKVLDPDVMPNGNPSDFLKVAFQTGVVFTNITLFNEVVDGIPRNFLRVSLPGANCSSATGGANETLSVKLAGTDSISPTRPQASLTITVRGIKPAGGQKCLK